METQQRQETLANVGDTELENPPETLHRIHPGSRCWFHPCRTSPSRPDISSDEFAVRRVELMGQLAGEEFISNAPPSIVAITFPSH